MPVSMSVQETNSRSGRFVEMRTADEVVRAFVPAPLPPSPAIDVLTLLGPLSLAERALGRLDGVSALLPNQALFLYMYVRKEAVLSSQIEGTQSTLSDLLRFESEAQSGSPFDDVREVSNYVDAMTYGVERMKTLPLSLRLIREMHARLLQSGRGEAQTPGEFRRSQNWVGGTRPGNALFVPPPPDEMLECLDAFERFIHEEQSRLPVLVKAGLLHVQFETIHPFLDGNGRIGRLLVTLYLCAKGVLSQPLLYLSLYLKTHRAEYYRLLQSVRTEGAWEEWLVFFLDGVASTANQAAAAATRIAALFQKDREYIEMVSNRPGSALRVYDLFQKNPYLTVKQIITETVISAPTVSAILAELESFEIINEITGRKWGRVFSYPRYLDIINEGTTPLPATA